MPIPTHLNELTIAARVESLLSQMTLEEKVGQMTQVDFSVIGIPENEKPEFPIDHTKLETAVLKYHVGSILNSPIKAQPIDTWRKMMWVVETVSAKTRLKIPVIYGIDAIHGATYTKDAVLFPQAINMAATFNPELSLREGEIAAREVRASG
jgi:beta-glucosidase